MGPVFPRSLIMVSGSGEADGGKQLLNGSQGHLPKAWEGNVATGKVKKVWAAKSEHPHLALNLWHCLATSSLVERSRGEKGRHWQGWHDAFPQVPQRTAKCKAVPLCKTTEISEAFLHLSSSSCHRSRSPISRNLHCEHSCRHRREGGSCHCTAALPSSEQAPLGHGRDVQGSFWLPLAFLGMPNPDLPCLQFSPFGEEAMGWQERGWQVGLGDTEGDGDSTLLPWGTAQKGHTNP